MLKQFLNFFGNKPSSQSSLQVVDYSAMAVDIHSHLIPGIDDGVKTMEDSIENLKRFEQLGFKKIITSPHVMGDGYTNSTATILAGRDKVRQAIKENGINLEFDAIAEYYLDETMYEKIEKKDLLSIGNEKFVLVELSYLTKANNVSDLLYKLQLAGFRVILAHPERYPFYHEKDFDSYQSLKDRNIYFQINLMSLVGKYGKPAKAIAERLIDENMVDFTGTDLHNIRQMETIEACISEKYVQKILNYDKLLNKTLV